MRRSFISIQVKAAIGLLLISLLFLLNAFFIHLYSQKVLNIFQKNDTFKGRIISRLYEFRARVVQSNLHTTHWIFRSKDLSNKLTLRNLHENELTATKIDLQQISSQLDKEGNFELSQQISDIIRKVDTLITTQKNIMQILNAEEDYEDPIKRFEAETLLTSKATPLGNEVTERLGQIIHQERLARNQLRQQIGEQIQFIKNLQIIIAIVVLGISLFLWQFSVRQITQPVQEINATLSKLSIGEIPPPINQLANDELGDICNAVNQLIKGLSKLSEFALQIGSGNYEVHYEKLSDKDVLGASLLTMRDNLKRIAQEDARRNWANEGAAKFADILRANSHSIAQLTRVVLSELIKYIEANQGCFFVIHREEHSNAEPVMIMMAIYAWGRHRIREKTVKWGEGLIGQAWAEKDILFLTEIPHNYIEIGSGLGQANPKNIVVVPLIFNQEVYGVIELASFEILPQYKVDFLKRIGENIAATLAATFANERTQRLLRETQATTEQLRIQEEEMRQNLEELIATQEQSSRNVAMARASSEAYEKIIESLPIAFMEINAEGYILKINSKLTQLTGYPREYIVGTNIARFVKQFNLLTFRAGEMRLQEVLRRDRSTVAVQVSVSKISEEEYVVFLMEADDKTRKEQQAHREVEGLKQVQKQS
ncbi:MAG: GAF domain-containing protein [Cytophagales bacterium]|nr:GAF domain-containing protein [Bernardetiaceae bacterium]MDW8210949.1 GAF domain-containing protein [Cytophagales bacterium]